MSVNVFYLSYRYRTDEDLVLTDNDKKEHPAKWNFLQFYEIVPRHKLVKNDHTLDELFTKVKVLLQTPQQ